jgi:hypothetical protein
MPEIGTVALKVRSKNAGPFWVTIDIFCGSEEAFRRISGGLTTERIADLFRAEVEVVKRFDMPELQVVKFSLPRPAIQGTVADRDMHGAAWGPLVAELEIN